MMATTRKARPPKASTTPAPAATRRTAVDLLALQAVAARLRPRFAGSTPPTEGEVACILVETMRPGDLTTARRAFDQIQAWARYCLEACGEVNGAAGELLEALRRYVALDGDWTYQNGRWEHWVDGQWQPAADGEVEPPVALPRLPRSAFQAAPKPGAARPVLVDVDEAYNQFDDQALELMALAELVGDDLAQRDSPPTALESERLTDLGRLLARSGRDTRVAYWAWQEARPVGPVR